MKKKRKKKRKIERKIEPLNLKNIQNVRKFFLNIFLLGFWPKTIFTSIELTHFLKLVSEKNFQNECSLESETKDLSGCTK